MKTEQPLARESVSAAPPRLDGDADDRAARHLRAMEALTDTSLAHLDLDALLGALLDRIREALGVDTAAVLLMSRDNALVATAARGLEEEVERGIRIPLGRGFAGRVAAEKRAIILDDVEHADVLNPILREKGIRSLLGVPLLAKRKVLGVLHVGTLRPNRFTLDDVHALEVVGERMAMAVEHARLRDAARRARRDAADAAEAVRVRDEFLRIAAHELKTPMTSVKGAAQLLARSFGSSELTPSQSRSLEMVDAQITKLGRLVDRLLDAVRLQAGALHPELAETDLVALVREVAGQWDHLGPRHEIGIVAPERLVAMVDALRIEQVLTNLIGNAVKYSPDGGAIEIALRATASTAILSVRDHGLGVRPEDRRRIFDRFYQAHADRSGMGLGLYITRQIVELHGGTIYADFPDDGGTRFVVSLPLRPAPASPPRAGSRRANGG